MNIEEQKKKLNTFKKQIDNAVSFDDNFKLLLGVELFDYIHANITLKDEFYRRYDYLINLAQNKNFNLLQDNLFNIIQEHLNFISLQQVKERQKEWNNSLKNKLKTRSEKPFLTLPELYLALQDKSNYFRLLEGSYYSPLDGEISRRTHIIPVLNQYKLNANDFFNIIFGGSFFEQINKETSSEIYRVAKKYEDFWYELEELIYRIPIQLHFPDFEKYFSNCLKFHPRRGLEYNYNPSLVGKVTPKQFREMKKTAITVIDDLLDILSTQPDGGKLPFEIKEDKEFYTLFFKDKQKVTFDKSNYDYLLIQFIVDNFSNENIYYHKKVEAYIREKRPEWKGRISGLFKRVNDQRKLIEIIQKGKTFGFFDSVLDE